MLVHDLKSKEQHPAVDGGLVGGSNGITTGAGVGRTTGGFVGGATGMLGVPERMVTNNETSRQARELGERCSYSLSNSH